MYEGSVQSSNRDPEDLLLCPYNDTHMIRAKRMPYHLMKCRNNYKGREYVTCPFNARHEMPVPELRHHIANCADRVIIRHDIVKATNSFKGDLKVPHNNWEPPPSKVPRYPKIGLDKKTFMEKLMISKSTIGMTKSERKRFCEKLRVNYLREQEGMPPVDNSSESESEDEDARLQEFFQKQISSLRLPANQPQVLQGNVKTQKIIKPTPVFNHSLQLAGIGRGSAVLNLSGSRPGEKKIQDSSNKISESAKPSRIAAKLFQNDDNKELRDKMCVAPSESSLSDVPSSVRSKPASKPAWLMDTTSVSDLMPMGRGYAYTGGIGRGSPSTFSTGLGRGVPDSVTIRLGRGGSGTSVTRPGGLLE